jgi:peptide/nickel transport system substrate-binding protein
MIRKLVYFIVLAVILVGCGGTKQPPTSTASPEVIVPPVLNEEQVTATPRPTEASVEPENEENLSITDPFKVNGVTMPFNRFDAVIADGGDYSLFDIFNPFIPNGEHYDNGLVQIVREYLWYVNYATGELTPWLAEKWEYNDDYTELRIYLREGVNWNDGAPFTARDVVFTLNMAKDPRYSDLGSLPHGDAKFWEEVYAQDDFTVVIKMTEPRPRQHMLFWCTIVSGQIIVPEHIWSKVDAHTFKNNPPIYTGPYKLSTVYPENKVFVWERRGDYWGKELGYWPAAKYAIYRAGSGGEQLLADLKDNSTDIFYWEYDPYQANKADVPQVVQIPYVDPCPRGAWFNAANGPHMPKPEFRRALSMLMNRETWATNIWRPTSKPAEGLWADYSNLDVYINEEAKQKWGTLEYNPEKALALLESIGYRKQGGILLGPEGEQVSIKVTTPIGVGSDEYLIGQSLTEELKAFGMNATFEYEESVFWDKWSTGEWQVAIMWFCGASVDPVELYNDYTCDKVVPIGEPANNGNNGRYCNAEFDEVLAELNKIDPDADNALDLYHRAFDLWLENPPGVPLIETYYTPCFNTAYWDNMPNTNNLYTVPFHWWGQLNQVYFQIQPKK